ncbi:uncharacterized protein LOC124422198 [Vespa crabro]|uniref:uncharacterized protein LOC124422198 n=1 Tax=Vespa crabro TaxID=7445 RepID=UPI001F00058A|nr:uncharacterized protein LOC124422198 [Vespa crabro]
MDFFKNRYYNINKALMYVIGIWHYQNSIRTFQMILSYTILNITTTVLIKMEIFENMDDTIVCIIHLIEELTVVFSFRKDIKISDNNINEKSKIMLLGSIKNFDVLCNVLKLEFTLNGYYEHSTCSVKISQTKEGAMIIVFGSVYAISLLTLLPMLLNVVAPLNESRLYEIPFPVEVFFDTTKYFHTTFFLIFFLLNIMGCVSIGIYSLILMILQHCSGLFELVGYIWENSVEDKKEIFTNKENKKIYKRIIRGVWFHKRTIKY